MSGVLIGLDIITWILVGVIAGALASVASRRGDGVVGDIVLGIVGACVAGLACRLLGWCPPFAGLASAIFAPVLGAIAVLLAIRLVGRTR